MDTVGLTVELSILVSILGVDDDEIDDIQPFWRCCSRDSNLGSKLLITVHSFWPKGDNDLGTIKVFW